MTQLVSQFETYFEYSSDPVLITNTQGEIVYVNHSWERLTQYARKEILKKNPKFLSSGKTPKEIYKKLWKALTMGKSYTTEAVIDRRKDGIEYQIRATFYPIKNSNDSIYFVQVLHDITLKNQILNDLQLHSLLLKKMQEGVCLIRVSDGVIVYTNPKFEHMLGYKKGELLNQHVAEVNYGTPEEAFATAKNIFRKLEKYKKAAYTIQNKKKDGSFIWCHVHTTEFIHAEYGRVWVAVHEDITNEKEYQDKIQKSEKRLKEFISQASDGIFIANRDGKYTYINDIGCKMLGYTAKELKRKNIVDLISDDDIQRMNRTRLALMKGKSIVSDWHLKKKDGSFLEVEVSAKILSDGQWLVLVRDITEKKKLEKMKDMFLSMVSHELKTPITSIKAFSQLLGQSASHDIQPKKIAYFAKHIESQSNKLNNLVSDLLHIGRIQSGRLTIVKNPFDINELIKNSIIRIQYTTEDHEIKQIEGRSFFINADKDRISQVLTNLLTNAIKYSPHQKQIYVQLQITADEVIVSVQDFGHGIAKEDQERIFNSFYRVNEQGNEGNNTSMGLGLYIVSEIIKKHHGRIWVESKLGEGSKFSFALPRMSN